MRVSITLDEVLNLKRCDGYPDERVKELFGDKTEATAEDILTDIRLPDKYKVWLYIYGKFLTGALAVEFAEFCADNEQRWSAQAKRYMRAVRMPVYRSTEYKDQVEFLRNKIKEQTK